MKRWWNEWNFINFHIVVDGIFPLRKKWGHSSLMRGKLEEEASKNRLILHFFSVFIARFTLWFMISSLFSEAKGSCCFPVPPYIMFHKRKHHLKALFPQSFDDFVAYMHIAQPLAWFTNLHERFDIVKSMHFNRIIAVLWKSKIKWT